MDSPVTRLITIEGTFLIGVVQKGENGQRGTATGQNVPATRQVAVVIARRNGIIMHMGLPSGNSQRCCGTMGLLRHPSRYFLDLWGQGLARHPA